MLTVLEDVKNKVLSLDKDLITYWEDVIATGINKSLLTYVELTPQIRWKWRMNLRGLLIAEFSIPEIYVYPNIRVNNLTNYDFNSGKVLSLDGIYLIDSDFIEKKYEDYLVKYKR